uniref:RING-CH-type domain-containing protein n=1 Tax=Parascaris univalens TaxID=6257 RepID=A0A914ZJZ8_PARUN
MQAPFQTEDRPKNWCRLCTRVIYLPVDGILATNRDKNWCLPCNCSQPVHHGCIAAVVSKQSRCKQCHYKFKYFQYGTWFDFLWRYPCRTTLPVIVYFAVVLLAAWATYKWRTANNSSTNRFSLLFAAAALLFLSTLLFSCWILYLVGVRREQFLRRHKQVTVFDHITPKNRRIEDHIEQLRAGAVLMNRSLSGLSSLYQQRFDQTSITAMTAFDRDHWLAASTPLLDYPIRQFKFEEPHKDEDENQNVREVYPPARLSSVVVVHEYSDSQLSTEEASQSPQWSKTTTIATTNMDFTQPRS